MTNEIDLDLPIGLDDIIQIIQWHHTCWLRKEAVRGRLMRIAGKHFTTVNAIREMLRICAAPRPPSPPVGDCYRQIPRQSE
jgi:hypothetical protein